MLMHSYEGLSPMRHILWLSFVLIGCQTGGDGGPDYTLTVRDIWTMELRLANPTTAAGIPLDMSVVLISEDGDLQEISDWTLSSDIETRVQYTRQSITPTLGGTHLLTVEGTYNERSYTATGSLDVTAGAPYTVNLELSDHGMLAGDAIQWTIQASDQWGNDIDTSGITPEVRKPICGLGDRTHNDNSRHLPGSGHDGIRHGRRDFRRRYWISRPD